MAALSLQQSPYAVPAVFLCGSPSRRKPTRVTSSKDASPLPSIRRPTSRESVEISGKPRSATPNRHRQRNQMKDAAPALLDGHVEASGAKSPSMQSIHPTPAGRSPPLQRRGTPPEALIGPPVSSAGTPPGPSKRPPPPPNCSSPYSRALRPGVHLRPVSRDDEFRPVPTLHAAVPRRLQSLPPIGPSSRGLPSLRNEDVQAPETDSATRPRVSSPEARSCMKALAGHRHINFHSSRSLASIHLINQDLPANNRLSIMLNGTVSSQQTERTLSQLFSTKSAGAPYPHNVESTLSQPLTNDLQPLLEEKTLSQPQPLSNNIQVDGGESGEKTLSQPLQKPASLPQPAEITANLADRTTRHPISPKAQVVLSSSVQTDLDRTRPIDRQGLQRSLSTGALLR
eukprot:TRINITY_DN111893_c0_g1_i1.p1 TRINITY_DN111893_c0_g1~~TRINITY_DN111893_c0_g1_i1.p1  ORF type:complete len:399 (-),score=30.32 TRINITY_DN111893_c0_g1_i1:158-1354(-)